MKQEDNCECKDNCNHPRKRSVEKNSFERGHGMKEIRTILAAVAKQPQLIIVSAKIIANFPENAVWIKAALRGGKE